MKLPLVVGREAAIAFLPRPVQKGMSQVDYHAAKKAYEANVETAAKSIAFTIVHDRAQIRAEVTELAAQVAEKEYAAPTWDKPVYSAKGCGEWIATAIRSTLNRTLKTNNPSRGARDQAKERDDDDSASERTPDVAATSRAHHQAARKTAA